MSKIIGINNDIQNDRDKTILKMMSNTSLCPMLQESAGEVAGDQSQTTPLAWQN